jgi:hypothetical protein
MGVPTTNGPIGAANNKDGSIGYVGVHSPPDSVSDVMQGKFGCGRPPPLKEPVMG